MRLGLAFIAAVLVGSAIWLQSIDWSSEEELRLAPAPAAEVRAETAELEVERSKTPPPPPARASLDRQIATTWFQYTDERGSVHFVESLDQVPSQFRDRAGMIEMSRRIQTVATRMPKRRAPAARRPSAMEVLEQVWGGESSASSGGSGEVIIYTTSWCGACKKAKRHLDQVGVSYVEKDIEQDPEAEAEFLRKSGGDRGVPLIDVGGEIMQGFSPQRLNEALARLS